MAASVRAVEVRMRVGKGVVVGDLSGPDNAFGVVVFAQGRASSRHSSRNRAVAEYLQRSRLGTLLMDLLTADEEAVDMRTRQLRFDIALLADRLVRATEWLGARPETATMALGYFGASTGAAAALVAAAQLPDRVAAIVSRGGRADLAGDDLARVRAPTLLIVGGRDEVVIELNRQAFEKLRVEKRLEIVPG